MENSGDIHAYLNRQLELMEKQREAQENDLRVLLRPAVPLPAADSAGWFGGAPRLPAGMPWPELDGETLRFVCQIDLSRLPEGLWSGLGPRHGWLAIFIHPASMMPRVLHVDGELQRRDGPGQMDADWAYLYDSAGIARERLPEWPVTMQSFVGEAPSPHGSRKGSVPWFPDPRDAEQLDLSNPAFHPVDGVTLGILIEAVGAQLDARTQQIDVLLGKKLQAEVATRLTDAKAALAGTAERFTDIARTLEPLVRDFDFRRVHEILPRLSELQTFDIVYEATDENGYAVVSLTPSNLNARPRVHAGRWWYDDYARRLYRQAVYTYTRDPAALNLALRERLERIWTFEALHEQAGMHTPHGALTTDAVLLDLPASSLIGWNWSDSYSLVLFIDWDDLANGDFSKVTFEISSW